MRVVAASLLTLSFMLACGGAGPQADATPETPPAAPLTPQRTAASTPRPTSTSAATAKLPPSSIHDEASREGCMIEDPGSWHPLLAASQPAGTSPTVDRGPHGIAEALTLHNGTQIRLTRGGCHHLGETWQLLPAPEGSPHQAAATILGQLVWRDPATLPNLLSCLADPQAADAEVWDCGDAHASVERRDDLLELSWSFAL